MTMGLAGNEAPAEWVLYTTPLFEPVLPTRQPSSGLAVDLGQGLRIYAARDEIEPIALNVYNSGDDDASITVTVAPFTRKTPSGKQLKTDLRVVRVWRQSGRGISLDCNEDPSQCTLVPELLVYNDNGAGLVNSSGELCTVEAIQSSSTTTCKPAFQFGRPLTGYASDPAQDARQVKSSIPRHNSKQYWITIQVPSDARGTYTSTVTVGALVVPITVTVWPFELGPSQKVNYIQYSGEPRNMSRSRLSDNFGTDRWLAAFKDDVKIIGDYGFNGLYFAPGKLRNEAGSVEALCQSKTDGSLDLEATATKWQELYGPEFEILESDQRITSIVVNKLFDDLGRPKMEEARVAKAEAMERRLRISFAGEDEPGQNPEKLARVISLGNVLGLASPEFFVANTITYRTYQDNLISASSTIFSTQNDPATRTLLKDSRTIPDYSCVDESSASRMPAAFSFTDEDGTHAPYRLDIPFFHSDGFRTPYGSMAGDRYLYDFFFPFDRSMSPPRPQWTLPRAEGGDMIYWQAWIELPLFNRMMAGFIAYNSGIKGILAWPFQASVNYAGKMGDPFNDFDNQPTDATRARRDQFVFYPGVDGAPIPTLQAEALREGIDDQRLIYTFLAKLEAAKEAGYIPEAKYIQYGIDFHAKLFRYHSPWEASCFYNDAGKCADGSTPSLVGTDFSATRLFMGGCIKDLVNIINAAGFASLPAHLQCKP